MRYGDFYKKIVVKTYAFLSSESSFESKEVPDTKTTSVWDWTSDGVPNRVCNPLDSTRGTGMQGIPLSSPLANKPWTQIFFEKNDSKTQE